MYRSSSTAARARAVAIALTLTLTFLVGCSERDKANTDGLVPVVACLSATSATQVPAVYAKEKGLFAKYGLDVKLISIDSGTRAVAALISGSAQICQLSGVVVISAAAAGADLRMVGGLIQTNLYTLMVPPGIRTAADLRGKAVAVSSRGSSSEINMRKALTILGLAPEDVTILAIGGQSERMAALQAGSVSAALFTVPESVLARQRGYDALLDMSALNLPDLHTTTVVTAEQAEKHRDVVTNFLKATSEAIWLLKRDKAEAMSTLSRYLELDVDKNGAALEETYQVMILRNFAELPYPSLPAIRAVIGEMAVGSPDVGELTAEQVTDMSFVEELERSGFFRELASKLK